MSHSDPLTVSGLSLNGSSTPSGRESSSTYYSRDEVVEAITDYYRFLCRTIHPPEALKTAPEGGWPQITAESMANLGRNADVLDLIRHLPYMSRDDVDECECHVLPETHCNDFPTPSSLEGVRLDRLGRLQPYVGRNDEGLPPDCLCIARGRTYTLFLDSTNGTVIWFSNEGAWEPEDYDMGEQMDRERDPRCVALDGVNNYWRDEPTYDLKYFFGTFCRKRIIDMNWVAHYDGELRRRDPRDLDEEDHLRRQILIDAGFPGGENNSGFDWEKWSTDERHMDM